MRYLVTARLKPGKRRALAKAVEKRTLGAGSAPDEYRVAGSEYLRDIEAARVLDDQSVKWVETCFCPTPLAEERSYWEEYFQLVKVQDAHARNRCRDLNGTEPWACMDCDCTARLEERLSSGGESFLKTLRGG